MQIFAIQEAPLLFLCYSNCLNFIMKQDYHPDNVWREGKWAKEMSIGAFQNRPSYCLRVVAFCTFFLSRNERISMLDMEGVQAGAFPSERVYWETELGYSQAA